MQQRFGEQPMKRICILLFFGAVALPSSAIDCYRQGLPKPLALTRPTLSVDAQGTLQALAIVGSTFNLHMGIEWQDANSTSSPIRRTWREATVCTIVNDIVLQRPGYTWDFKNGVIHIYPEGALTDGKDFLTVTLPQYAVDNDFVSFASRRLQIHLQSIVSPTQPSTGYAGSAAATLGDRRTTISLQSPTVRDILDAFITSTDLNVWLVFYPADRRLTGKGFYATRSLQADYPPETSQPNWVLAQWGRDPITRMAAGGWPR